MNTKPIIYEHELYKQGDYFAMIHLIRNRLIDSDLKTEAKDFAARAYNAQLSGDINVFMEIVKQYIELK